MDKKVTLFQYLYDTLTAEIRTEKIGYGESLPSMRQICQRYNVGMRTAKEVLNALRQDGYIRTEMRKNAVVIYRNEPKDDARLPMVEGLLARGESIVSLLEASALLFPHSVACAALLAGEEHLDAVEKCARNFCGKVPKEQWRTGTALMQGILALLHNPVLTDLYVSVDLYCQVPVFDGFEPPVYYLAAGDGVQLRRLLDWMRKRDYSGIYACVQGMFAGAARSMRQYLGSLSAAYPQLGNGEKVNFEWKAKKGKVLAYGEIARQITEKIAGGEYRDGTLIPSIGQLASEHGVSPVTVGKSLAMLNRLGFLNTANGRGSLVTLKAAKPVGVALCDDSMARGGIGFLYALQLYALTCKSLAQLAFPRLDEETVAQLSRAVENPDNLALPYAFIKCLARRQPYSAVRTVFDQIDGLYCWGYWFAFAVRNNTHYKAMRERCRRALGYIRQGEAEAFANLLQDMYIEVLDTVKKVLGRYSVYENVEVETPRPNNFTGRSIE